MMTKTWETFNPCPGLSGSVLYYPAFYTGLYTFYPFRINQMMAAFYDIHHPSFYRFLQHNIIAHSPERKNYFVPFL
jgi:hypothetical protein